MICFVMFFCCKQKTAYEMRISDWSSDVCSSDLKAASAKAASAKAVGGRVLIFDTTLRDGEQSPGCSMNLEEKLQVAQILEEMGVDIIEAGFPIASKGDFEAVQAVAAKVKAARVAGLAPAPRRDIRSEEHTSELQSLMRISYAVL